MNRELDLLAKEFNKTPVTVLRKEVNLYQTNILAAAAPFLKKIEQECKRQKVGRVTLLAIVN